jgi:uncharacterized protein with beta-barrel porin domain
MACLARSILAAPILATPRWQRRLACAIVGAASLFATEAMAIDVANQTDWNTAVAAVAAAGTGSSVSINITSGFTLSSSLAQLQASNANVTVNITGNSQTINGAAAFQGIQVNGANAPTVNISSLAITNTVAVGGAGGAGQNGFLSSGLSYGSGGGGGGGLGAGGGLFVGGGANVTLAAVTFTTNSATGGTGGNGGVAQNTASSPTGGNGGAGGALNGGGAVGGGGAGGLGGNTGTQGTIGTAGATPGAGGGGGGGSGTLNRTSYTPNNNGGGGNAGGGNGAQGGDGVTNNNGSQGPGADGGSGGNGGGAQGGAIYVATGGTLTILDSPISGAAVTGGAGGNAGTGQGPSNFNGSPGGTGTAQGAGIFLNSVMVNIGVSGATVTYANTIAGTGLNTGGVTTAINKTGAGMLTLSATNTFTGNINISAGTLAVAGTANLGNANNGVVISDGATFAVTATSTFAAAHLFKIAGSSMFDIAAGTTTTLQGVISDGASSGSLVKTDTGTLLLSATNTYTGATDVNGGTLRAGSAGAFGSSSTFAVAAGATLDLNGFNKTFGALSGAGTVTGANTTISGTFTPGNGTPGSSMAIVGNLAFQSGAQYMVQLNPATSSLASVTGSATLNGATVQATYAAGTYISKQYTILTTTGGVNGTFNSLVNTNLPSGFTPTLGYDATHAYLNLTLNFVPPPLNPSPNFGSGLNVNQQNVGNALINFFNTTGSIPLVFGTLTPAGLSQISGETATGSQQTTFDAMTQFMGVMTDPFITGRGDGFDAQGGTPTGYASTQATGAARDANAMFTKAPVFTKAPAIPFDRRWSVWAAGFGGSQTTDGNTALGSNSATSRIYGTAVGADYRISPYTLAGFALAGGGTGFSVANGGSGHSDLFQAGAFIRHTVGQAYISGALAYGWQDVTTNRTVTVAGINQLRAEFNANAFSGRVEGGYRFVTPAMGGIGITPYAAAQFTTFDLPAYAESVLSGANTFALAYGARDVTDTRSELGIRTDKSYAMQNAILTLRSRVAWAHDFDPNRGIGATFQALPGASFVVNGAAQASDSALTTASAEIKWPNGWSAAATFEGEFSEVTRSYAGKGVVRYAW